MSQQVKATRLLDVTGASVMGLGYTPPGRVLHVDTTLGASGNDGKGWGTDRATNSITNAMTLAAATPDDSATRGRVVIFVAPGAYTEGVSTPTNAQRPHSALIGVNPLDTESHGAVYWASSGSSTNTLTVLARGWRISGLEFEVPTAAAGVKLDDTNGNAYYTCIDNCHFTGGKYGVDAIGAPTYVTIKNNLFAMLQQTGSIGIGATAGPNCNIWTIDGNKFIANKNHIVFTTASAPYSATIIRNVFHDTWVPGGSVTSAIMLTTQGASNVITQNYLGGTYSVAGGYQGGSTDEWFGNYAAVSGGVTKDDPA